MSPLERPTPPAGEDVHLPGPSLQPLLLTVGITAFLIGLTTTIFLAVAGGILTVAVIAAWIRDTRREIGELPLEHRH